MDVKKALEATGKAIAVEDADCYAHEDIDGVVYWFDIITNEKRSPLKLHSYSIDYWQPYPEKKEIKPENAGELWEYDGIPVFIHTWRCDGDLRVQWVHGGTNAVPDTMIHNQEGWERIRPPVEDESIEKCCVSCKWWDHSQVDEGRCKKLSNEANMPNMHIRTDKNFCCNLYTVMEIPKDSHE